MPLQRDTWSIDNRPPRWKIKGVDWGMCWSKIPDSTLELSNSVKELNDDFQMRLEHASSLVLGMTSLNPPSGRKTPWWNGQCRAIMEEALTSGKYISLFLISIIYIYTYKIKKITWCPTYFLKKYAKTGNQRKLRKWREQMHPFCYLSSENINCRSIQAARKKYVNNIKRALDFYYYSPFLYGIMATL